MIASPADLTYFIEVSKTQNLSRTAKRIGISQPSLTLAIQRLELTIGTELLIRSKSGVTLTKAGKCLLSHAKELLQLWDTVKAESLATHYEVQGSFTLGIHPSVALTTLSHFMPKLLMDYPKLEIQLKHDLSRNISEEVINCSIDLGFIVNPIKHPDLIIQKLYTDKVTFWHATKQPYTQQLDSDNAILILHPELIQTQWLLKRINRLGIKFKRILTSTSLEVIANLTANGCGVGIIPTSVAESMYPNKLLAMPNMPSYQDEICLVYRHENRRIKGLQAIVHSIKTKMVNT
jgi:DNA-binding transcriptional LysR family regulator